MTVKLKCGNQIADVGWRVATTLSRMHASGFPRLMALSALAATSPGKMKLHERLGSWLFIRALALVLFQFLSRIKLRAADHALV